jgi:hypothetical protein
LGGFTGQFPAHFVSHRPVDHRAGALRQGFVVADEPAILHQPAQSPLDDPTAGQHVESFGGRAFDDLDADAVLGAVADDGVVVAAIHPYR